MCALLRLFRKSVCLWTRSFILQGLQLVAGSGRVNVLPGVIMSPKAPPDCLPAFLPAHALALDVRCDVTS